MHQLQEAASLIQAIQGTPLTILFAMLLLRRPLGITELSRLTGYHRQTVRKGLLQLKFLNLVTQTSRYIGWQLTNKGYQLPLIGLDALGLPNSGEGEKITLPPQSESQSAIEGEKITLPPRSSYTTCMILQDTDLKPTTTTASKDENFIIEGEKITLPHPDQPMIINLLTTRCGSPPHNAAAAAAAALSRGDTYAAIQTESLRWLAYCQSPQGATIHNPGIFIAKRISQGIYASPNFTPTGEIAGEIGRLTATCVFCGPGQPATNFVNPAQPLCEACARELYPNYYDSQEE